MLYSYPGCCVTTSRPIVCPSKDTDQLTTCFINDIHSRLPSLCGQQIKYSKKPVISSNTLLPVQQIRAHPNTKPLSDGPSTNISITLGKPNLQPLRRNLSQVVPNTRNEVNNGRNEAAVPVLVHNQTTGIRNENRTITPMPVIGSVALSDHTNRDSTLIHSKGGIKRPLTHATDDGFIHKRFCSDSSSVNPDISRVVPGSELTHSLSQSLSNATPSSMVRYTCAIN